MTARGKPTTMYRGARRALSNAVARGDREAAKRLTKKAVQLHMQLYGGSTTKDGERDGVPFNDPLPF